MATVLGKPWWRETIETIVYALLIALVLRYFVIQAFWIPSGSMIPTLQIKDRIIVLKFLYYFVEPQRGDIIVFEFPLDPSRDFIKRIIGLPGDTVAIKDGTVSINGESIDEPYVVNKDHYNMDPVKVPPGRYFVMGDNRPNSDDGRYWGFLPEANIKGKAVFRFWPLNRLSLSSDW